MRISQAIKSILHGVSTTDERLRHPVYLEEQINMQTVTDAGLYKRPPADLIAINPFTGYQNDETLTTIVKSFLIGDDWHYMSVQWTTGCPECNKTVKVFNASGTELTVVADISTYLAGVALKSDIEITTQEDTVFITNKTATVTMAADLRTTDKVSLIHVTSAPGQSTTLTISFTDVLDVARTVYLVTGVALSTRGTNTTAANIRGLINAA